MESSVPELGENTKKVAGCGALQKTEEKKMFLDLNQLTRVSGTPKKKRAA